MRPAPHSQSSRSQIGLIAAVVAWIALFASALLAAQMVFDALAVSYADWLGLASLQTVARNVTLASELARAALLVTIFIVAIIAVAVAGRHGSIRFAAIFCWGHIALAVGLLAGASLKFTLAGGYAFSEFAHVLGVAALLVVLAAVLTHVARAIDLYRYYTVPFVFVLVLHLILMLLALALNPALDLAFIGNLLLSAFVGLVILVFFYLDRIHRDTQSVRS